MGRTLYKEKIANYLNRDQKTEELGFDNSRLSYIPEYFSSYVEQERIPNFVCLVSRFGEVAHYSHQGFKNTESQDEINNETIFRIYSMTKPITSVAIMMLYERGLIRLEHELYRYLPEFKNTEAWETGDINNFKTTFNYRQNLFFTSRLVPFLLPGLGPNHLPSTLLLG